MADDVQSIPCGLKQLNQLHAAPPAATPTVAAEPLADAHLAVQ